METTKKEKAISPARTIERDHWSLKANTWLVYKQLREQDKKRHEALCKILKEMLRSDPSGNRRNFATTIPVSGQQRISLKDRLIYKFDDNCINTLVIGDHYDQH